jgi:AraC family transcriptional regulator of adaptative response/methylated-DNA-[protein]-cysteine methyltransferase
MTATATLAPRPLTLDPAVAWHAVQRRDPRADGRFVFAVRTTGVYCRPSCPSRHARRENVRFFAGPDAAEAAGFRACLRCRPRGEASAADRAVARARSLLDARGGERVTLDELARATGMTPTHLQRIFTAAVGESPRAYAARLREERLRGALRSEATVSRAIYEAGYSASSRAYAGADRALGMTPAEFRRRGAGVELRVAVAPCSLGHVVVAATARGIAAVRLGADPRNLVEGLREEFAEARIEAADARLAKWLRLVVQLVDGIGVGRELPVDLAGTEFQRRVWAALREVPSGETVTYAELARRIGRPAAVRAVAGACAANPAAVVVPCHRVVRSDGGLGGYRWGVERKAALLEVESSARAGN